MYWFITKKTPQALSPRILKANIPKNTHFATAFLAFHYNAHRQKISIPLHSYQEHLNIFLITKFFNSFFEIFKVAVPYTGVKLPDNISKSNS